MLPASPLLFLYFWRPGDPTPSRTITRLPDVTYDLSKLSELGLLVNDLADRKVPIDEGVARLKQIDNLQPPYRNSVVALGYALCGAGFAVLLSANWNDVIIAALLSLVVYAITLAAGRSQWLSSQLNFTAAIIASI